MRYIIGYQNPRYAREAFVYDKENREELFNYPYGDSIESQLKAKQKCEKFLELYLEGKVNKFSSITW